MNKITFNNTRFHLNDSMKQWCHDIIGPGGWDPLSDGSERSWSIESMFGNTTFEFREETDLVRFLMKWK